MKKWIMIIIGVVILAGIFLYFVLDKDESKIIDQSMNAEDSKNISEIVVDENDEEAFEDEADDLTHENAEIVAFNFMLDFVKVAPPTSSQEAENRIMDVLSKDAKTRISRDSMATDLAKFIGVQDVPDQGVSVEDLQIVSEKKEVYLVVGMNYSGGRVLRNVYIVAENGEWKVDKVTVPVEEEFSFVEEGNIVRNNPGMRSGVWYLVYDKAGKPASTVELKFSSASICASGAENNTCEPEKLETGSRAKVMGEVVEGDVVIVTRLELK